MRPDVFFIINSLGGGGAERVLCNLANTFHRKRYKVAIICLNYTKSAYTLEQGIPVSYLVGRRGSDHIIYRLFYAVQTYLKLVFILLRNRPKCVVSFMTTSNLWSGLACSVVNIPFVVSERTTPDHTVNQFNPLLKRIAFLIYNKSKGIVIPAKGMSEGFKRNKSFSKLNNFVTIHNAVDSDSFISNKPIYPNKRFILGVGRLDRNKGFDVLINAYNKLSLTDIDLLISGEGPERQLLTKQIEDLGLSDKVKLVGFKHNIQDYYSQADLFVLASKNEGYPNALIEAMSVGCPSIATNCEFGPPEIIEHRVNGMLVEVDNVSELAEAIREVLNSPDLRYTISMNGRRIKDTNSESNISSKWEKLIFSHEF